MRNVPRLQAGDQVRIFALGSAMHETKGRVVSVNGGECPYEVALQSWRGHFCFSHNELCLLDKVTSLGVVSQDHPE